MTAPFSLGVGDVCGHASASHCINHRAAIAKACRVLDSIGIGGKVCARALVSAPAHRSERNRILQALSFVFVQLGSHSSLQKLLISLYTTTLLCQAKRT